MSSSSAPIIQAEHLGKTYQAGKIAVPVLRDVSFEVARGEFVSIVGPSGSGKSTLFYILGGLTRANSGHARVDGVDFATLPDGERTRLRKRKIGFIFQKYNLLPTLSARGNVEIAHEIAGGAGRGPPRRPTRQGRRDHGRSELRGAVTLRGGTRRALFNQPAIVLADEPTGNLDSKTSDAVLDLLRHSNKQYGQTVLMITHNPEAASFADRTLQMRDGALV